MIDGKTREGPWANMTPESWRKHGVGQFCTGYGQRYQKQPDGKWLEVDRKEKKSNASFKGAALGAGLGTLVYVPVVIPDYPLSAAIIGGFIVFIFLPALIGVLLGHAWQ
jgi:hypothetical protein